MYLVKDQPQRTISAGCCFNCFHHKLVFFHFTLTQNYQKFQTSFVTAPNVQMMDRGPVGAGGHEATPLRASSAPLEPV